MSLCRKFVIARFQWSFQTVRKPKVHRFFLLTAPHYRNLITSRMEWKNSLWLNWIGPLDYNIWFPIKAEIRLCTVPILASKSQYWERERERTVTQISIVMLPARPLGCYQTTLGLMVDWCNHLHEKQRTETAWRQHLLFITHGCVMKSLLKGAYRVIEGFQRKID